VATDRALLALYGISHVCSDAPPGPKIFPDKVTYFGAPFPRQPPPISAGPEAVDFPLSWPATCSIPPSAVLPLAALIQAARSSGRVVICFENALDTIVLACVLMLQFGAVQDESEPGRGPSPPQNLLPPLSFSHGPGTMHDAVWLALSLDYSVPEALRVLAASDPLAVPPGSVAARPKPTAPGGVSPQTADLLGLAPPLRAVIEAMAAEGMLSPAALAVNGLSPTDAPLPGIGICGRALDALCPVKISTQIALALRTVCTHPPQASSVSRLDKIRKGPAGASRTVLAMRGRPNGPQPQESSRRPPDDTMMFVASTLPSTFLPHIRRYLAFTVLMRIALANVPVISAALRGTSSRKVRRSVAPPETQDHNSHGKDEASHQREKHSRHPGSTRSGVSDAPAGEASSNRAPPKPDPEAPRVQAPPAGSGRSRHITDSLARLRPSLKPPSPKAS
jgi:hypothetical protein